MAFTTTPLNSPKLVDGAISDQQSKAQAARERAINMLVSQSSRDARPTNLSVEEIKTTEVPAALAEIDATPPAQAPVEAQKGQVDSSEASAPKAEAPKEATAPSEAPLSSQYVQLARKEKAIRLQAQELKSQQAALQAKEDAFKARETELLSQYVPKSRFSADPWSVMSENGVSYEQLTQQALNAPSPEAQAQQQVIAKLEAKIAALEEGHNSTKQSIVDSQTQAYTQAVNQLRSDAKQLVKSDDNFETIRATDSYEDVVELITKTFKDDGVLLTVEQAAAEVEEYLVEEAMKVAKLNKIQQRLKPQAASPVAKPTTQPQPTKTLTNAQGASRQLTSRERAILAFKGEQKT